MKGTIGWMVALVMVAGSTLAAQQKDADADRLVQQYLNAWNKGDADALAALYVENGMRTDNNQMKDQMVVGREAIQAYYAKSFAGDGKGTKLSVKQGRTHASTADVRVQEGTWEVTGGPQGPRRGSYLNTYVRQGGDWKIAAVGSFPETPPAK